jgi:hypothetical protein
VLAAGVLLAVTAIVGLLGRGDQPPGNVPFVPTPPGEQGSSGEPLPDPFAWDPDRTEDFERRATAGTSHALYAQSPGGAEATAARTARWRPQIEAAARQAEVDPNRLEALVFLESAGREDIVAPQGLEGAAGLTQIVAETGQNLLGMRVDTTESARLARRAARERRRGHELKARELDKRRRAVDERFDPEQALAGTARYLTLARTRFGREDLAFVAYHMGIGNLESVLRDYSGRRDGVIKDVVADDELSYAKVYFDSTPARHAAAQRRLAGLGDDSSNYWWKLGAAEEIMRLFRTDREELRRLSALQTAKNSAEEVLHPAARTPRFETPAALRAAWDEGVIEAFPDTPDVTGLARDRSMGELAGRLGQPAGLYRGLRPEALAVALYIGAYVREFSGEAPLIVTSTVRDDAYQAQLVRRNREATRNFSLHTTGWAFDLERRYVSKRQALAFQFVLDRLQVLNAIAWVREPQAIHVTASADGRELLPLLERIGEEP